MNHNSRYILKIMAHVSEGIYSSAWCRVTHGPLSTLQLRMGTFIGVPDSRSLLDYSFTRGQRQQGESKFGPVTQNHQRLIAFFCLIINSLGQESTSD